MKRILIDYTYYQQGSFHGGGEYGDTVLRRLLREKEAHFGLFYYDNKDCRNELIQEASLNNWEIFSISTFSDLPGLLSDYHYDTFYSALPYQADRDGVLIPSNVKYVATYHGLRELELLDYSGILKGEYFGPQNNQSVVELTDFYGALIKNTSNRRIITDSLHSKYSLLKFFPSLKSSEIDVLYPPMKMKGVIKSDENAVLSALNTKKECYSLMVSGGIYYKNAIRAAVAYDHIFDIFSDSIGSDYKVLITGVDDSNILLDGIKNKSRFIVLPYLSTELLEILYKNAHTFVFPSFNEGFGYPPLEAMYYVVPCLCAASASISEILGEMAIYFNPLFVGEIENRILQSFSADIRTEYKRRIAANLNKVYSRQQADLEKLVTIITS